MPDAWVAIHACCTALLFAVTLVWSVLAPRVMCGKQAYRTECTREHLWINLPPISTLALALFYANLTRKRYASAATATAARQQAQPLLLEDVGGQHQAVELDVAT